MPLPFSHDAFLDVFAAYNVRWWPAAVLLWVATASVVWRWLGGASVSRRALMALLGVHWAWSGAVYHWGFFRAINPAAAVFAAAFVVQAVIFAWLAMDARATVTRPRGLRGVVASGLVIYGLAYPALGFALGLTYPRLPLFAVPCPTALLTAGVLLSSGRVPRLVGVVPILWAMIGASAAFVLGMTADLALIVAGVALAVDLAIPLAPVPKAGH